MDSGNALREIAKSVLKLHRFLSSSKNDQIDVAVANFANEFHLLEFNMMNRGPLGIFVISALLERKVGDL